MYLVEIWYLFTSHQKSTDPEMYVCMYVCFIKEIIETEKFKEIYLNKRNVFFFFFLN